MTYILTRYTPTQTQSSKLIAITYILHEIHFCKHNITIENNHLQEKHPHKHNSIEKIKNHHASTKLNFDTLHFIV